MRDHTMRRPWGTNRLTERLKIEYPIVQGALGGFSSERLSAAVSNFGGLGTVGLHSKTPEGIRAAIAEMRSLTTKPFSMNLWVSVEDEGAFFVEEKQFQRSLSHIAGQIEALGAPLPVFQPYTVETFDSQVQVLLEARVSVFSFIFGIPRREVLDEFRRMGTALIGTATTVDEAKALEDAGVDAIVASGFEAGGHRGSFLGSAEESLTGTFSLVPQVVDAVAVSVIAAGGIADARGVVAASMLGAEAVQMGTAFLACEGSGASDLHRATLLNRQSGQTGLTRGFTGRLARGIRNELMEVWERAPEDILPYPLQRRLVRAASVPSLAAGKTDFAALWAGQSANLCTFSDVQDFLHALVRGVEGRLAALIEQPRN